jgi:hypothetical protein
MYGTPKAAPPAPDVLASPIGWKCTGYTHGCFCPACSQRDIARAEYLNTVRAHLARERAHEQELAEAQARMDEANELIPGSIWESIVKGRRHG